MSRSEEQEFVLFLCFVGACTGALGPVGTVVAIVVHAGLRFYYVGIR